MIRSNVEVIGDFSYILRVGKLENVFGTSTRLFLGVLIFVVAPLLLLAKSYPPQQHPSAAAPTILKNTLDVKTILKKPDDVKTILKKTALDLRRPPKRQKERVVRVSYIYS